MPSDFLMEGGELSMHCWFNKRKKGVVVFVDIAIFAINIANSIITIVSWFK